jgi:hypothetical protein
MLNGECSMLNVQWKTGHRGSAVFDVPFNIQHSTFAFFRSPAMTELAVVPRDFAKEKSGHRGSAVFDVPFNIEHSTFNIQHSLFVGARP